MMTSFRVYRCVYIYTYLLGPGSAVCLERMTWFSGWLVNIHLCVTLTVRGSQTWTSLQEVGHCVAGSDTFACCAAAHSCNKRLETWDLSMGFHPASGLSKADESRRQEKSRLCCCFGLKWSHIYEFICQSFSSVAAFPANHRYLLFLVIPLLKCRIICCCQIWAFMSDFYPTITKCPWQRSPPTLLRFLCGEVVPVFLDGPSWRRQQMLCTALKVNTLLCAETLRRWKMKMTDHASTWRPL